MNFGILEIGSTNTKAYIYKDNELINLGTKYIPFKTNYAVHNKLLESDVTTLLEFIESIKDKVDNIYAYGTSIFRKLSAEELENFKQLLMEKFNISFKVVSAEEENEYTVKGVLANNNYDKDMVVIIGGGGSTEVAYVKNREIMKKVSLDFGAMDITEKYPELKDDKVETSFDDMLSYTLSLIGDLDMQSDIAVLAGGDYIYFYETVGYEMKKNNLYTDVNQPYLLDFNKADEYDKDILTKSLDEIKERCKDNTGWWNGARGMRFCMNAVARNVKAKYIIPTRINMLIGISNEIKERLSK